MEQEEGEDEYATSHPRGTATSEQSDAVDAVRKSNFASASTVAAAETA